MPTAALNWHARFQQQATWTNGLRQYLYQRAGLNNARRVLDVGCGTGALLGELAVSVPHVIGVDINFHHLSVTTRSTNVWLTQGDAQQLPYPNHTFDLTLCHFLLLWVEQPLQAVSEMARVTRPGGIVLALAEPDYGGRIDYPAELATLGDYQSASLRQQGADPSMGRKLAGIFHQAGLTEIETGVLGGQWVSDQLEQDDWQFEWQVLEADLKQMSEGISASDIARYSDLERQARQRGERVLFVPTFWAWGKKQPS